MFLYVSAYNNISLKEVILLGISFLVLYKNDILKYPKPSFLYAIVVFLVLLTTDWDINSSRPFLFLFIFILVSKIDHPETISNFMKGNYIILLFSLTIAFAQFLDFEFSWQMRKIFGFGGHDLLASRFRFDNPYGMHMYSITLAEHAAAILPFFMYGKIRNFFFIILALCLQVKSLIIGICFKHYKKSIFVIPFIIIYFVKVGISEDIFLSFYLRTAKISSLLMEYTSFGEGLNSYSHSSLGTINPYFTQNYIEQMSPHIYFISYAINSFGVLSLIIAVCLNIIPIILLLRISDDKFSKKLLFCLLASNFHSLTHNGGMLLGDYIYFIVAIISINYYSFIMNPKRQLTI